MPYMSWKDVVTTPMGMLHIFLIALVIGYGWHNGAKLRRIVIEFNGKKHDDDTDGDGQQGSH